MWSKQLPAAAKTSRAARIENVLLLVLRCAIFALLAFAAARPVIVAKTAKLFGADVPRTVVFIVFTILKRLFVDRFGKGDSFKGGEYYLGMLAGVVRYACRDPAIRRC